MSQLSDDNLIERIANGEQQALLHLYDRYSSRVYALGVGARLELLGRV